MATATVCCDGSPVIDGARVCSAEIVSTGHFPYECGMFLKEEVRRLLLGGEYAQFLLPYCTVTLEVAGEQFTIEQATVESSLILGSTQLSVKTTSYKEINGMVGGDGA